jgi:hypothetical protein
MSWRLHSCFILNENERHYALVLYAEYRYAECRYAECRYADCRGAFTVASSLMKMNVLHLVTKVALPSVEASTTNFN